METLKLTRPDDWHIHLRAGKSLDRTVADAARQFARTIVMPNLVPPVTTADMASAYRQAILAKVPAGSVYQPLMTLYLTDQTTAGIIQEAHESGVAVAAKLYPAGATTNSDSGVTDIENIHDALAAMEDAGMPLLVHGEVTDADIDVFDREKTFIDRVLAPLVERYPALKVVFEHITTKDAVDFVARQGSKIAATITAHHLLLNRNDMLVGGIRPHYYCLPVLKRNIHQQALIEAATSASPKFFLGTDSAPHSQARKENACGCAGVYTAFSAIELYAEVFERAGRLGNLEAFASFHGPDFYGLARNTDQITLEKSSWQIPDSLEFDGGAVIPFLAGQRIGWRLAR